MYGGGNSHMAIRANEFGLPAAIGVGEALYKSLLRAKIIELDATNRKIDVIR
jgi:glutamine kinase